MLARGARDLTACASASSARLNARARRVTDGRRDGCARSTTRDAVEVEVSGETSRVKGTDSRRRTLRSMLALGALAFVGDHARAATPTLPKELTEPDEIFSEDFNVTFAGVEVDHKDLIYALVIGQTIGFVGSAVAGSAARKRAEEIERLNATLLKVNKEVRKELRSTQGRKVATPMDSTDDCSSEVVVEIISLLKNGKAKLKAQAASEAKVLFTKALTLIKSNESSLKEPWKAVRKAERGLGAAASRLKEYEEALIHMKTVLALSQEHNDLTVATDAYGIIADLYAEMDQIEVASDWYDKYFEALALEDAKEAAETASR